MSPFAARTRGEAMRGFGDAVMNKESEFGKHPEDYALYKIGDYDTVTGVVTGCQPVVVETALAYVTDTGIVGRIG